jgi:GT2 family glycosyltransferase
VAPVSNARVEARGKFLFAGDGKYFVKGVSYGAFRPNEANEEYHDDRQIRRDFAMMAAAGFNTVRIPHTMPPRRLLDIAGEHGLRVMAGLSAEQYVGYLIDRRKAPDIRGLVRQRARVCADHPALLCYGLGNEIPSSLARWIGRPRLESYIKELYWTVKDVDSRALVTYVNYPTTEYLHLPFLDLLCFNVYLEQREKFEAYLARLHNLAGDRPLVMSEVGLDALRNGVDRQAEALDWQIRTSFGQGCAGVVVFSWTDEWFRGGAEVDDWEFGLTGRDRRPKKSLTAVSRAFAEGPFPAGRPRPRVSVVVCTYNGARTIGETLEHLGRLNYPDYETIVVDDGSTDGAAAIAAQFPVRLIRTENRGLSSARNTGCREAEGEIVAYIDDDAYPDPDWLDYLIQTLEDSGAAAAGGPNLAPEVDGWQAQCIARAPGGPAHVLLNDRQAEHIPGCNMAFRKSVLNEVGGFDEQFRVAGDDVDVCWRILESGLQIAFSPAAVVWHHRRPSVAGFWRQQKGYGKSETLLARKWPQKFNAANQARWAGRVYRAGLNLLPGLHPVIYHGVWGEAPYQALYSKRTPSWQYLPLMPEWYLANAGLLALSLLGAWWSALGWAIPILLISSLWPLWHVIQDVRHARFAGAASRWRRMGLRALTVWLHVLQPLARLTGRLQHGLAPWRKRGGARFRWPRRIEMAHFDRTWIEPRIRLEQVEAALQSAGCLVHRSGAFDAWDLEVYAGVLGGARLLMAVEDHGSGTQYVRFAAWPRFSPAGAALAGALLLLAAGGWASGHPVVALVLGLAGGWLAGLLIQEAGAAVAIACQATSRPPAED